MKVAFFDAHHFERKIFDQMNEKFHHELSYFEVRVSPETAKLAAHFPVVCAFAHDRLDSVTLKILKSQGVELIALRSAGFNHVDLLAAAQLGLKVVRVPA